MLPAKKWKHEKENLMKGDVVMLTYEGNVKDDYVRRGSGGPHSPSIGGNMDGPLPSEVR